MKAGLSGEEHPVCHRCCRYSGDYCCDFGDFIQSCNLASQILHGLLQIPCCVMAEAYLEQELRGNGTRIIRLGRGFPDGEALAMHALSDEPGGYPGTELMPGCGTLWM